MNIKKIVTITLTFIISFLGLLFLAICISGDFSFTRPINYDKLSTIGFFIFNVLTPFLTVGSILGVAYQYFQNRDKDRQILYQEMLERKVKTLVAFINSDYYKKDIIGNSDKDLLTVFGDNISYLEEYSGDPQILNEETFLEVYNESIYIDKETLLALTSVLIRKLINITDYIKKYNVLEHDTLLLEGLKFNFFHSLHSIIHLEFEHIQSEVINGSISSSSYLNCIQILDDLIVK